VLILPTEWQDLWRGKDPFEQIFNLHGEEFRNMDGRRTLRFELLGRSYFVKIYAGLGWGRLFKSLLTLRKPPVATAKNEWLAIQALTRLGVETMTVVAYGERGRNPVTRQSFLVTEDLAQTESLEDFCRDWKTQPPRPQLKRALIARVAQISRMLHKNGINHRDYYLCHFLLDISSGRDPVDPANLHLYLIDLHRVQVRNRLPARWRLKDLAGLYFSSLEIGLTPRDYYRFIQVYTGGSLREALALYSFRWRRVIQRGAYLKAHFEKKVVHNE